MRVPGNEIIVANTDVFYTRHLFVFSILKSFHDRYPVLETN